MYESAWSLVCSRVGQAGQEGHSVRGRRAQWTESVSAVAYRTQVKSEDERVCVGRVYEKLLSGQDEHANGRSPRFSSGLAPPA